MDNDLESWGFEPTASERVIRTLKQSITAYDFYTLDESFQTVYIDLAYSRVCVQRRAGGGPQGRSE